MPPREREVVRARPPVKAVTVSMRGEKRIEDEYYERVLQNGHKWGFPEPKKEPYTPPPPPKPEPPVPRVPWWKNFCDPRWLLSVRARAESTRESGPRAEPQPARRHCRRRWRSAAHAWRAALCVKCSRPASAAVLHRPRRRWAPHGSSH